MNLAELNKIAEAMVAPGRGILAADELSGTIKKRFDAIGAESTEDNRRDYRELLFRSTEAMSKHISGVILYDETIRQNAKDGTPLVKVIEKAGALPGIKVDKGTKPLPFCPNEVITEGLDGLRERLVEYRGLGAKFAKWRAVIDIGAGIPSHDLHQHERPCARPLRRAVPGRRHRADRRARSADGRRPRHRPLLCGHRVDAQAGLRAALLSARGARRHGAQAQHGDRGQEEREAGRASRRSPRRPCGCSRPACRPPCRASPSCPAASRTRTRPPISTRMNRIGGLPWRLTFSYGRALAGGAAKGLGRKERECRGRATRFRPPRHDERPRDARPVEVGPGKEGGMRS